MDKETKEVIIFFGVLVLVITILVVSYENNFTKKSDYILLKNNVEVNYIEKSVGKIEIQNIWESDKYNFEKHNSTYSFQDYCLEYRGEFSFNETDYICDFSELKLFPKQNITSDWIWANGVDIIPTDYASCKTLSKDEKKIEKEGQCASQWEFQTNRGNYVIKHET